MPATAKLPLRVSFRFSKRLFYAKCLHDRGRSAGGKVYDIVRHTLNGTKLKLGIHSQPGMLVTLSGMDGCGKTLHAQALDNAFQLCDIRSTVVWSRSGSSRLTDAVFAAGRAVLRRPQTGAATAAATATATATATQEQRSGERRRALRNPLVRQVWLATVTADLVWQYTRRVRLPLLRGRVVICDRYVYDALADIAAVTGGSSGLLCRLLVALSPKPSRLDGSARCRHLHGAGRARRLRPERAGRRRCRPAARRAIAQHAAEQTGAIYVTCARASGWRRWTTAGPLPRSMIRSCALSSAVTLPATIR